MRTNYSKYNLRECLACGGQEVAVTVKTSFLFFDGEPDHHGEFMTDVVPSLGDKAECTACGLTWKVALKAPAA